LDKLVDFVLSVASISAFLVVNALFDVTSTRRVEFEWPQELVDVLEVLADGENFMDEILNADDSVFLELLGDDFVVGDGNPLSVDLTKTTLVDELFHSLQVGCSPSNIGLNEFQHFESGGVESDKDCILNLAKSEKSQNLFCSRINTIDTPNSNNQSESGFRFSEEVATRTSISSCNHQTSIFLSVFLGVFFGSLEL